MLIASFSLYERNGIIANLLFGKVFLIYFVILYKEAEPVAPMVDPVTINTSLSSTLCLKESITSEFSISSNKMRINAESRTKELLLKNEL